MITIKFHAQSNPKYPAIQVGEMKLPCVPRTGEEFYCKGVPNPDKPDEMIHQPGIYVITAITYDIEQQSVDCYGEGEHDQLQIP